MEDPKKNSILIVDDENTNIMALSQILSPMYTVYSSNGGQDAIGIAQEFVPDVILLDVLMPGMDGYAVIEALKECEETRKIPVILLSAVSGEENEKKGLSLGAADYISKPFDPVVVLLRIQNQIRTLNRFRMAEKESMVDQLTALPNRRSFDDRLNMEWVRAIRDNTPISLLVIDIDRFKEYNEAYGRPQGDAALVALADIVSKSISRPGDFVARWGGEEFFVLLPDTDSKGALHIAERIRTEIGGAAIPCADGAETRVTVSIGAKTKARAPGDSRKTFVTEADRALFRAKEAGRNRVCLAR